MKPSDRKRLWDKLDKADEKRRVAHDAKMREQSAAIERREREAHRPAQPKVDNRPPAISPATKRGK